MKTFIEIILILSVLIVMQGCGKHSAPEDTSANGSSTADAQTTTTGTGSGTTTTGVVCESIPDSSAVWNVKTGCPRNAAQETFACANKECYAKYTNATWECCPN